MSLPPKKKRRLESLHLPDEMLDRALSFLSPENVLVARCVNTRWAGIASNHLKMSALQTDPLSREIFRSLAADNDQCSLDPTMLWKNLLVARDGSRKSVMRENHDYHNVINAGGVPPFCNYDEVDHTEDFPHWVESSSKFRFAVRLWAKGGDGKLSSVKAEIPKENVFLDDFETSLVLQRGMGEVPGEVAARVARQLQRKDYYALEILVRSISTDGDEETNNSSNPTPWATLYSSLYPLVPYGGGDYEEYQAMPWFLDAHDDEEANNNNCAENWATLPFCEADFTTRAHGQSLVSLRFHWRTRQGLDYQDFSETLGALNCLVLWKHRVSQAYGAKNNHDDRLSVPKCELTPFDGLAHYVHKPLEAYTFRIDIQKKQSDPSDQQSIFFEQLPEESLADEKSPKLHFEIPTKHRDHFPWAEDYEKTSNIAKLAEFDENSVGQIVECDEVISVYVIDRHTGKQAKLFQSGLAQSRGGERPYLEFHPFLGFEKSAALTQYSFEFGAFSPNIPVPSIRARMVHDTKDLYEDSTRCLDLSMSFLCFSGQMPQDGGGFASGELQRLSRNNLLVFLEKGLTYY